MDSLNENLMADHLIQVSGVATQTFPNQTLYMVGLPIGNLGDITLRAIWILSKVDIIAAEDTRETKKLLEKYGLNVRLMSVREHNEHIGAQQIIDCLAKGMRVALVTDAGTPAVSDPGAKVAHLVSEAGFRIMPIPGCSAVITALSASGIESSTFTFVGFLPPQTKARREQLDHWLSKSSATVFYEAPHRIKEFLQDIAQRIESQRRVVIGRELTKKFEEFTYLTGGTLATWATALEPKGEFVVLVDGRTQDMSTTSLSDEQKRWLAELTGQLPLSKLAALAAKVTGLSRSEIYSYLLESQEQKA